MGKYRVDLGKCFYNEEDSTYNVVRVSDSGEEKVESELVYGKSIPEKIESAIKNVQGCKVTVTLADANLNDFDEARIVFFGQKNNRMYAVEIEDNKGTEFSFDVSVLKDELQDTTNRNYRICLETVKGEDYVVYALCEENKVKELGKKGVKKRRSLSSYICHDGVFVQDEKDFVDRERVIGIYSKRNGRFLITTSNKRSYVAVTQVCNLKGIKFQGDNLIIKVAVELGDCEFRKIIIKYRHKLAVDAAEYPLQIDSRKQKKHLTIIEGSIDLTKVELKSNYWDVQVILVDKKTKAEHNLPIILGKFKEKFRSFWYNGNYKDDKGCFLYPHITSTAKLALQYREWGEYDGFSFKIKERVAAVIYKLFKKHWQKKNIYLVFEKFCMMAQDNGYFFFKYCMENNMEEKLGGKIYYVIDRKSLDREKLLKYKDSLIDFMSIKHIVYALAAKLLISTDTKDHAYAWRSRSSIITGYIRKKQLVFLQHGVIALKKIDFLYSKGHFGSCDMFIVSSDFERKIVEDYFGYRGDEIAVTGLARWDVLEDKSEGSNEILITPTWRSWLEDVSDEDFKKSSYYINYMNLLNSERLQKILEEKDLKLNFYLHSKFRDHMKDFAAGSERMRLIAFGEEPLNEVMMKCKMLITDYSSVSWDVYYQAKPVVFFQFDLDEYLEAHGSYLDMDKELFGEREITTEGVINQIENYANEGFKLKEEYAKMREFYFKYIDEDNSKRICECIKKKW